MTTLEALIEFSTLYWSIIGTLTFLNTH